MHLSSQNPAVCINCFSRGVHCGSQEAAQIIIQSQDSRLNLKERVARLEHLISSMLSGQVRPEDVSRPNLQLPRESQSTSYSTPIEPTRPGGELQDVPENIPAFSLFENDILANDETGFFPSISAKNSTASSSYTKGTMIRCILGPLEEREPNCARLSQVYFQLRLQCVRFSTLVEASRRLRERYIHTSAPRMKQ